MRRVGRCPVFWVLATAAVACAPQPRQIAKLPPSRPLVTRGDIGRYFGSTDEAAVSACDYLRTNYPEHKKWEYAGCIYGDAGQIKVGLPETIESATFCRVPEAPVGTIFLADYHGHLTKEHFSELDMSTGKSTPQYLCAPSGAVLRRTADGKVMRLK